MKMTNLDWLVDLDSQIWRPTEHVMRANMTGHTWTQKSRELVRKLTHEEWGRVQAILDDEKLLTSLHNCGFGFTCGMAVYEHPTPVYPGIPLEPRRLIFLESHHLPFKEDRFEAGWTAFSPFTHSQQNTQWLAQYGMESPKEKHHYDY